jgi:hypothetical protein
LLLFSWLTFDTEQPVPVLEAIGAMDVQFGGCNHGLLHYKLGSWTDGFIVINRVAQDNLALCESLANPAD